MTSLISHTTFDALDACAQSEFWAAVLGFAEDPDDPNEPGDEECPIFSPDGRTTLLFVQVPDRKQVKNRVHLDVVPADLPWDEELAGVLARGRPSSPTAAGTTVGDGWCWRIRRATSSAC